MFTQCPACHTVFRLTAAQLNAAGGAVRCGSCGDVFAARERLLQELPAYLRATASKGPRRPAAAVAVPRPEAAHIAAAYFDAVPRRALAAGRRAAFAWGTGVVFALLALLIQYGYFMRADLANYPQLRPAVLRLCGVLHCAIPPQRDVAQIAVLNRQVYEDPHTPGALLVSAVIENRAAFAQPFPILRLSLSAIDGKVVAQGHFTPRQYLSDRPADELMPPHQPAKIKIEIADPSQGATSFEFAFL